MPAGTLLSTGLVVSTRLTVIVKVSVPIFPCASVAVQVTVVGLPFCGKVEPDAGAQETGSVPSMLSVAVGFVYVTTFGALTSVVVVMFGWFVITGAIMSVIVTVTVNEADAELVPSLAVQVTVVGLPFAGKLEPEFGVQVTGTEPATLSVAVGLGQLTALGALTVVVWAMFPGMLPITGGMLSM